MKKVIAFLLFVVVALTVGVGLDLAGALPSWIARLRQGYQCAIAGGFGGCVYCLRAVYKNACVEKNWDKEWEPWYYIRPFNSIICGATSFIFLKAGLLALDAGKSGAPVNNTTTNFGLIALAFIAGLNVDKFVAKLEDIAQATWGIERSRAQNPANPPTPPAASTSEPKPTPPTEPPVIKDGEKV